jgi:hypothetical protein
VHGDVFRPPAAFGALTVYVGTGVQLLGNLPPPPFSRVVVTGEQRASAGLFGTPARSEPSCVPTHPWLGLHRAHVCDVEVMVPCGWPPCAGMVVVTLVFAVLGFLSPANRGGLMTAMLLLFALMGLFAGHAASRLFKMFQVTPASLIAAGDTGSFVANRTVRVWRGGDRERPLND